MGIGFGRTTSQSIVSVTDADHGTQSPAVATVVGKPTLLDLFTRYAVARNEAIAVEQEPRRSIEASNEAWRIADARRDELIAALERADAMLSAVDVEAQRL
jgi:hypothetical protein